MCAVCAVVAACGGGDYPPIPIAPQAGGYPFIHRDYDTVAGGLQITGIAYNEDSNRLAGHPHDEWVIVSCLNWPYLVLTSGWTIQSASTGLRFPLPDTVDHVVYLYTHGSNDTSTIAVHYLGVSDSMYLWRNDHDTARLYDPSGALISTLGY